MGIRRNQNKNEWLKKERGVCFEDVIGAIESDRVLGDIVHHNQSKYPGQKCLIVMIK